MEENGKKIDDNKGKESNQNNNSNQTAQTQNNKRRFEVITVTGAENVGKTTLVWAVYNKLLADGAESVYFHIVGADAKDFHAVVIWNGKIIAFCSIGDRADKKENNNWKYIEDGIEMALNHNAEILINALSLNSGLTEGGYKNLLKKTPKIKSDKYVPIDLICQSTVEKQIQQKQIKLNELLKLI